MPVPLVLNVARMSLLGLALATLAGCAREDEAAMRARLDAWFALGDTMYFSAARDCAAGVYRVRGADIGAAMPVVGSVGEMIYTLPRQERAALDVGDQAPDVALVDLNNEDRPTGMAMRRAGLEARACMDDGAEGVFRSALLNPSAILAYDMPSGTVMILNPDKGLLVAAMGAG